MNSFRVIDTSKWQGGKVDYAAAKRAGYVGVILRIGYSKSKDKCFEKDYANAVAAGLLIGVYFYTISTTSEAAEYDASRVLGWLNDRKLQLPIYYDIEDEKQKGMVRRDENSAMLLAFVKRIRERYAVTGYVAGLYSGEYFFNQYFYKPAIPIKVPLWIAKYASRKPEVGRQITMWQYGYEANTADFYPYPLDRSYWFIGVSDGELQSGVTAN